MRAEHVATQQKSLKSHLVEPLLTVLVQHHLADASKLDLAVVLANKTPLKVNQNKNFLNMSSLIDLILTYSLLSPTDSSKTFFSISISSWSAGNTAAPPKEIKLHVYLTRSFGSTPRTPVSLCKSSPSFRYTEEQCHHPTDGSSLSCDYSRQKSAPRFPYSFPGGRHPQMQL